MTTANTFHGFQYSASEVLKYICVLNHFTLILKSGDIVKFEPKNALVFEEWLTEHSIQNIRQEEGWIND